MNKNRLQKIWKEKSSKIKVGILLAPNKENNPIFFQNENYFRFVRSAGLEPIAITPYNNPSTIASMVDMLLIPGGADIDPTRYREQNIDSYGVDPVRDLFEAEVLRLFVTLEKPVFGICRGMQLIFREYANDYQKEMSLFTYVQHIHDHKSNNDLGVKRQWATQIVTASSLLVEPVNVEEPAEEIPIDYAVNSLHHQGILMLDSDMDINLEVLKAGFTSEDLDTTELFPQCPTVAPDFTVTAYSPIEEHFLIEGFDIESWNVRAVQWHPEELNDPTPLRNFALKYFREVLEPKKKKEEEPLKDEETDGKEEDHTG